MSDEQILVPQTVVESNISNVNSETKDQNINQNNNIVPGIANWILYLIIGILALTIIILLVVFLVPPVRNYVMPYHNREYFKPSLNTAPQKLQVNSKTTYTLRSPSKNIGYKPVTFRD